ncbi:MAG: hypothetical protein L0H63_11570 [Nitrococcus sp.]|nr:hypothetical protein [Nitrococcus sp.]
MDIRIAINIVIGTTLAGAGLYLLSGDSLFIRSLSNPAVGRLFAGWSFFWLVCGLFASAALLLAVARGLIRGSIPLPPSGTIWPDPIYKGKIIVRYWPLMLLSAGSLLFALLLMQTVPTRTPQAAPHSHAARTEQYQFGIRMTEPDARHSTVARVNEPAGRHIPCA